MTTPFVFAVGSQNPVKLQCVQQAVALFWPAAQVVGVNTDSQVSAQPQSEQVMRIGAQNRAAHALQLCAAASHGVGIEGGIEDKPDGMWAFAVVIIRDRHQHQSEGQTGRFQLPEGVARLIREEGLELGDADDRFFGRENSKQNEGAIGILSDGKITRVALYQPAVVFALLPFLHPDYYDLR